MERKVYSYREALEIVEDFMVKSGIRQYCENICHGKCCDCVWDEEKGGYVPCWESKNACWRNEGRRLPCSIFVCSSLLEILPDKGNALYFLKEKVIGILWNIMKVNPYFNPNTEDIQKKFWIPKEELEVLKSINVRRYRRILKFLRKNHIQIYGLSYRHMELLKHRIARMKTGSYASTLIWGWHRLR